MAATAHQQLLLPSLGLAKEVDEEDTPTSSRKCTDDRNSQPCPRYPDFKHRVTREPLWLAPSWAIEDLFSRGDPRPSSSQLAALAAALRTCTRNKDLAGGAGIHDDLAHRGLLHKLSDDVVIMYVKCGELGKAKELLDMHKSSSDVVAWTALIAGYAREGHGGKALDCFEQMQLEGIHPNAVTYACVLKACAGIGAGAVEKGREIHDKIARMGMLQNDSVLGGALVDMYAKCGAVSKARQVLDGLPSRNVVSWSALIAGYTREGLAAQAMECFDEMQQEGIRPNAVTYVCVLKACAMLGAADKGERIHDKVARQGLLRKDIVLGGALVNMYAKCGAVSKAQQVLDGLPSRNVVCWNALIAGYTQEGHAEQALDCFEEMLREGIPPDVATYACILNACAVLRAAEKGKQIHDEISRQGLLQNDIVLGSALVSMYAECCAVSEARQVLDGLPARDVAAWNALIAGYIQVGDSEQALGCFEEMQREGVIPGAATYVCALKACASLGAADKGKQIHEAVTARQGLLQNDALLGSALVSMYAKCEGVSKARQVLDGLPLRDVSSWNALIAGYTQEGDAEQALHCYEEMRREGILPNAVTCTCLLNVCSHQGLVEEGQELFATMRTQYGVDPDLVCYSSMVDLLGRAGHLDKAVRLIQDMPTSDYSIIWHSLLGSCRKWAEVDVGRWAFEQAVKLDKTDGPSHVLMANIYASAGMAEKAENIEAMRIRNRAWKKPGRSWWRIDPGNVFLLGRRSAVAQ